MNDEAKRELITYEYRLEPTPCYMVMVEGWDLIDIFPNKRIPASYIMVFRHEYKEGTTTDAS